MADIKVYGEGTNGIQSYKSSDPYSYEVDNRPLKNLANNDYMINAELQSMTPKTFEETPDGSTYTFTFKYGEMAIPGSLQVYLNGVVYNPSNISLINSNTQFQIINGDIVPELTDDFYAIYRIANTVLIENEEIIETESGIYISTLTKKPVVRNSLSFYFNGYKLLQDDGQSNVVIVGKDVPYNFVGTIDYTTGEYDIQFDLTPYLPSGTELDSSGNVWEVYYQYYSI